MDTTKVEPPAGEKRRFGWRRAKPAPTPPPARDTAPTKHDLPPVQPEPRTREMRDEWRIGDEPRTRGMRDEPRVGDEPRTAEMRPSPAVAPPGFHVYRPSSVGRDGTGEGDRPDEDRR